MKPPFFVCSRPYRAHSFAGENGHNTLPSSHLLKSHNKPPSQAIPHPSLFHSAETCRPSSSHFFIRGSLSSAQERQPPLRSPQPASLKSRPARVPSQGWQKNRKLFAQTRGLSFGSAQLFPRIAPLFPTLLDFSCGMARIFCCIELLLLLDCTISFAFPRLTLRSPSNTQVPPSHRSPTTSSSLCLPSVNSLSTTTAAP